MPMVTRTDILNTILKNGKLIHWACNRAWYERHDLMYVHDAIYTETSFLDKFSDVTFRERVFYIQNGYSDVVVCKYCQVNRRTFDKCELRFRKSCNSTQCKSKLKSDALCVRWQNMTDSEIYEFGNAVRVRMIGRKLSDDTRQKIRDANLGKIQSCETIQKRVESRKCNGRPWHSTQSKRQISETNRLTHNSDAYIQRRHLTHKSVASKMSEIMKIKVLSGEFTPCITNSWTRWSAYVVLDDGTHKQFRSTWEAIFWMLNRGLEYETIRIPYRYGGINHTYIVDFCDDVNHVLYEVKPRSNCDDPRVVEKVDAAMSWCKLNGYQYVVIDEDWFSGIVIDEIELAKQPQLKRSYEKLRCAKT